MSKVPMTGSGRNVFFQSLETFSQNNQGEVVRELRADNLHYGVGDASEKTK
jgi:hypothetical protein